MPDVVEVTIPVDAEVAAQLGDSRTRDAVGRMVSRMLRREEGKHPLIAAMDRLAAEAERRGLTPEILKEELAAFKAERSGVND